MKAIRKQGSSGSGRIRPAPWAIWVRASGIGSIRGKKDVRLPIPAVLNPGCIAALMRSVLDSATVAIVKAASRNMPLMGQLTISPLHKAMSCYVGAMSFGYYTDSGFWVWNGMCSVSWTLRNS